MAIAAHCLLIALLWEVTGKAVVHLMALWPHDPNAVRHRLSRFLFQLWEGLHLANETCSQGARRTLSCKWHKPLKAERPEVLVPGSQSSNWVQIISQLSLLNVRVWFHGLWQQISPSSCLGHERCQTVEASRPRASQTRRRNDLWLME